MVEHIYPSLPLRKKKCYVTVRLLKKGNFAKCLRDPCSFTAVCKYMTYGGSWIFLDFVLFCSFDRLSNNFRIAFSYHDAPYNLISWWERLHLIILNLENHQDENRLISPERVLLSCIKWKWPWNWQRVEVHQHCGSMNQNEGNIVPSCFWYDAVYVFGIIFNVHETVL